MPESPFTLERLISVVPDEPRVIVREDGLEVIVRFWTITGKLAV